MALHAWRPQCIVKPRYIQARNSQSASRAREEDEFPWTRAESNRSGFDRLRIEIRPESGSSTRTWLLASPRESRLTSRANHQRDENTSVADVSRSSITERRIQSPSSESQPYAEQSLTTFLLYRLNSPAFGRSVAFRMRLFGEATRRRPLQALSEPVVRDTLKQSRLR